MDKENIIYNGIINNTVNKDDNYKPYPNIDKLYGPYNGVQECITNIPNELRSNGLTVGIKLGNAIVEYWFQNGNLTPKYGYVINNVSNDIFSIKNKYNFNNYRVDITSVLNHIGINKYNIKEISKIGIILSNGIDILHIYNIDGLNNVYFTLSENGDKIVNYNISYYKAILNINNNTIILQNFVRANYFKLLYNNVIDITMFNQYIGDGKTFWKILETNRAVIISEEERKCHRIISWAHSLGGRNNDLIDHIYILFAHDDKQLTEIIYTFDTNNSSNLCTNITVN